MKDFFISYTTADRFWAEWIAWELEAAGYTTIIQAWDFRPGENFVVEMQRAASEAERTVLVLSEDYLKSAFALAEWTAAFAQDPTGTGARLVPIRVKPCEPGGLLRAIIFVDLVGLGEEAARDRLREGVQGERAKPDSPPAFPGMDGGPRPAFPGGDAPSGAEEPSLARRKLIRASFAYAVTTGLVFLASWMGLVSVVGADEWLERHFLRHMQRFLHPPRMDDLVLLRGADDGGPLGKPGPGWREAHADMVEALSRAGARVIVFDLDFEERSSFDERLADAIRSAAGRNTSVVVGAKGFDLRGTTVRPRMAPVFAALPARWGTLGGDAAKRRIELARRIPAAEPNHPSLQAEAVPVVPSLALQAVMQYDSGPARSALARLRPSDDVVEVLIDSGPPQRRIPVVDSRMGFIVDVASDADFRSHSYTSILAQRDSPQALSDFAGKVVVIGFEVDEEVWPDADGRKRYEMEIQASAIAQLLGGSFLRRPGPASQLGSILLMGGIGWLLRDRFRSLLRHSLALTVPTIARPVEVKPAFLVILALYAVLAFAACKVWRVVPRFSYDVAALLLTYFAVGAATRGPFGPPLLARFRKRPRPAAARIGLVALVFAATAAPAAASEPAPVALIEKITVDDQDRAEATDIEVRVIRAASSSLVPARRALLLFEGDQVITGANVSLVLLFEGAAAEEEKKAVVGAATQLRVSGSASLFLILGRILSNVRGFFEVERPEGTLGARGTEFEVRAAGDGSTEVLVLEGAVEVAEKGERPASAEEPRPAAFKVAVTSGRLGSSSLSVTVRNGCARDHIHEVRAPESLAWVSLVGERFSVAPGGQRTAELDLKLDAARVGPGLYRGDILVKCLDCDQEPGCAVSSEPLGLEVTVKGAAGSPAPDETPATLPRIASRLEKLTLRRGEAPEPAVKLTEGDVRSVVDWTSRVVLAGRPAYARRGSALYLESVEARDRAFRESRFRAVWLQSAPDYERLGNIYCDWGEGAKGLEAYVRAEKADPARRASPGHLAGLAEAFRLKGRLEESEARVQEALRADPRAALALVTLGNLRLDQANVAADRGDVRRARDLVDKALGAFDEASRAPEKRAVAAVARANRGEGLLALGALDRQEGKDEDARRRFAEAEKAFETARELHPPYPYSDTGLGDVSRAYFGVEAARGQKDRAQHYLRQSEERYRRALAERRAPFAAWTGLGSLYRDAGRDDLAIEPFSRAVELRPNEPLAHYRLGAALAKSDPQRAAQAARTYLELEAPAFKQGQRAKLASATARTEGSVTPTPFPTPTPTPRASPNRVPSVLGLSLEDAERSLRAAGLKAGDVDRRTSSQPEGTVIDQRPGPGEPAPAGSGVDLVVAAPAPVAGDVKVPNVEGDAEEEALRELRGRRLVARVRRQASCDRLGRVIAQEPRKDSRVREGSEVTITVASAGDRPVKVPKVERLPRSRAEAALRKSGLQVGRVRTSPTSSAEPELVLDQEPEAGQLLAPGCAVDLTVAEPEPLVRVPDFRGLSEKEALSRLRSSSAGLTPGRVNGGGSGGKVVKQEPDPGTQVPRGSAVSLWIRPDAKSEPQRDRVIVPDVRGRALKSAVDTIRGAGLSASVQGRGACVTDQRPAGKASAERGSTVTLYAGSCPIR